jgi:hypothetical protein
MGWALLLLQFATWDTPGVHEPLLRLSEEAEAFRQVAPQTVSQETLRQRAMITRRRFRPKAGSAALEPRDFHYASREIVSEYGFSWFKESPDSLHEFRQVVSVDSKPVRPAEAARRTLTLGIRSPDDRVKKRMLEDFARHGLVDAATDFGQLVLLFTRRNLAGYEFRLREGQSLFGADRAMVIEYRQVGGPGALTVFEQRQALRVQIEGEIWVRASDRLPLRITMQAVRSRDDTVRRDEATVEYAMSQHGALLPASVTHRTWDADVLVTENEFRYAPFRRFAASADIKFTEVPDPPK